MIGVRFSPGPCNYMEFEGIDAIEGTYTIVVVKNISGTAVSANAWIIIAPEFTRGLISSSSNLASQRPNEFQSECTRMSL